MQLSIVPVYAALLALLYIYLTKRVIDLRKLAQVALGDGADPALSRAIRVHGNFAEYVPLALVLLAFAELRGAPFWLLHGLGAGLLAARLAHAWGVSRTAENFQYRIAAMMLTFAVLGVTAAFLLVSPLLG